MSHHRQPIQIQVKFRMILPNKPVGGSHVLERSRPSTTRVADSPVFNIEGRYPRTSQRFAQMSSVSKIISRTPEAAVNIEHGGVRPFGVRQALFDELIRVAAIGYAFVGRRLRPSQDVLGGTRCRGAWH